jgi:predicted Rossmann-fold nucleotide-binding protein
MAKNESISPEDMKLLFVTDSVEDLITHIETYSVKKFGLVRKQYKPKWWFSESKLTSKNSRND